MHDFSREAVRVPQDAGCRRTLRRRGALQTHYDQIDPWAFHVREHQVVIFAVLG